MAATGWCVWRYDALNKVWIPDASGCKNGNKCPLRIHIDSSPPPDPNKLPQDQMNKAAGRVAQLGLTVYYDTSSTGTGSTFALSASARKLGISATNFGVQANADSWASGQAITSPAGGHVITVPCIASNPGPVPPGTPDGTIFTS